MPLVSGGQAPYAPPLGVTEILRRFRDRGLATPITTEVVERAGVSETLSRRTVQALKLLGFIDTEGMPTPEMEAMSRAPEAEYKEMLGEFVSAAYGDVFQFADPATDSYDRVRDAFRPFNPKGQQERMVTLFLGLLDYAGVDTSAASVSRRRQDSAAPTKPRPGTPKVSKGSETSTRRRKRDTTDSSTPDTNALPAGLVGLLHQIPAPGKSWTKERRDNFMRAFEAVLDYSVAVAEDALTEEDGS